MSVRQKFVAKEGDHITLLNIFRAYKTSKENKVTNFAGLIVMCIALLYFILVTSHDDDDDDLTVSTVVRAGVERTLSINET